jgi:hypothetical protein
MEILVRSNLANKWEKAQEQRFENEAALQNILYEAPDIIPIEKLGENIAKPRLFVKEAGLPGSGNTDLIGIDENGGITIIECKLATNPDIRRKVIGQVFEYAAYLWQMTYDEFDSICSRTEKWGEKRLADVMREIMKGAGEEWSEEIFRDEVSSSLAKGDFRLIIAVDALNDELRRIIEFLNSRGEVAPRIYALELRQFATPQLQMLVPELFGPSPAVLGTPPPPLGYHFEIADPTVRPKLQRLHDVLVSRFGLIPRSTPRTIAYSLPNIADSRGLWMAMWPRGLKPSTPDMIAVQISRQLVQYAGGDPDSLYQQFIQEDLQALPPAKVQQTLLIDKSTDLDKWLEVFQNYGIPSLAK